MPIYSFFIMNKNAGMVFAKGNQKNHVQLYSICVIVTLKV